MRKYFLLLFIFLLIFSSEKIYSQDSSKLRISLLTCSPGEELYSIFGHSAIRVTDSTSLTYLVYNYGTFNFDDEGFYLKFVRGKLLYYLSIERFIDFRDSYKAEGRGLTEQVLELSAKEKIDLQHALNENLKEENKYYHYDFFLDNCTTMLRDLIVETKKPNPVLPAVMPVNTKFRQAIHQYLDAGKQHWSKLGIDILLGAPTDAIMTPAQQEFLPDNLMFALNKSSDKIVKQESELFTGVKPNGNLIIFTPLVLFFLLFVVVTLMSLSKNTKVSFVLLSFDKLLFFVAGLLGIIIILMWFATDHSMTKNNYNIIWAWPTHFFAILFLNKKSKFKKYYFGINAITMALLLFAWNFLPQQLNASLIPIVALLGYRSFANYSR
ncbi:MAG: DUF4105 domain-containing protein [Ferruginibacter sp.]